MVRRFLTIFIAGFLTATPMDRGMDRSQRHRDSIEVALEESVSSVSSLVLSEMTRHLAMNTGSEGNSFPGGFFDADPVRFELNASSLFAAPIHHSGPGWPGVVDGGASWTPTKAFVNAGGNAQSLEFGTTSGGRMGSDVARGGGTSVTAGATVPQTALGDAPGPGENRPPQETTPVPEPATIPLVGLGMVVLFVIGIQRARLTPL